jgi:hypothetical protein
VSDCFFTLSSSYGYRRERTYWGEEPVVHEVRTNHLESDDVFDFEPYHDESDDEADYRKGVAPLHAEDLPNRSFSRKNHLIGAAILVGIVFVLIATELFVVRLQWLPRAKQPGLAQPPPPNRNYDLNLPEVYLKLDVNRSSIECRVAWETLTNIPCHEGIWMRGWDAGVPESPSQSIDRLVPLVCQNIMCLVRLTLAQRLLHSVCVGENAFALEGYLGRFNTTLLEPNAQDVVDVLLERHMRTCRTSPPGDADGGYCMTNVNTRFGIVDGIRPDGLEGLNSFLRQTDRNSSSGETTTCRWCAVAWFKEKLGMWEEGKIVKDGSVLSLPEYLRLWERAGIRCAGERFGDVYNTAIKSYVDRELLEKGWLPKPSGDIAYLIRNGASTGDYPVPEVIDLYSNLIAYINNTADDGPDTHKRLMVVKEYMACLDSIPLEARSISFYPFISWANITAHKLSDVNTAMIACSEDRAIGADELHMKFFRACPNCRNGENKYEGELATLFLQFSIHPILKKFGTTQLFQFVCYSADYRRGGVPCAAIYAQWGMQDWALIRSGENMQEIIR